MTRFSIKSRIRLVFKLMKAYVIFVSECPPPPWLDSARGYWVLRIIDPGYNWLNFIVKLQIKWFTSDIPKQNLEVSGLLNIKLIKYDYHQYFKNFDRDSKIFDRKSWNIHKKNLESWYIFQDFHFWFKNLVYPQYYENLDWDSKIFDQISQNLGDRPAILVDFPDF